MFGRNPKTPKAPEIHPNDVSVYEPVKYLGIFALQEVDPKTADGALVSGIYQKAGVVGREQGPFIDMHLRQSLPKAVGAQAIRESLGMVADYISAHPDKLAGQDVVGVTYPRLGNLATRFGFESQVIDGNGLPQKLAARINEIADPHGHASKAAPPPETQYFEDGTPNYSAMGDEDTKVFGEFAAVQQSGDDLIERFGGHDQQ